MIYLITERRSINREDPGGGGCYALGMGNLGRQPRGSLKAFPSPTTPGEAMLMGQCLPRDSSRVAFTASSTESLNT